MMEEIVAVAMISRRLLLEEPVGVCITLFLVPPCGHIINFKFFVKLLIIFVLFPEEYPVFPFEEVNIWQNYTFYLPLCVFI